MGLLDTYLSDKDRDILNKSRSKIGGTFFVLFVIVIVFTYLVQKKLSVDNIPSLNLQYLQSLKNTLLMFSFLLVVFIIWILFKIIKPAYILYLDLITDLLAIKYNATSTTKPLTSRENTLLRFRELNYAVNNTVLYATISDENRIAYISKKFEDYIGLKTDLNFKRFEDVLTYKHNQQHKIRKILTTATDELVTKELKLTNHQGEIYWLEMSIINMDNSNVSKRRLIVCNDITKRKQSNLDIQRVNRDKFVAEVQSQKDLSQQIMTAQEDERMRIAKDIHDGIGQILTALRFSIDGIDLTDEVGSAQSLALLKEMFGQLIHDVRSVTFSLAPPELKDHGVPSVIRKMSNMLGKLSGKQILYENTTEFDQRLSKNVEINIYRVVQEAVNNALKYANSNYILITLEHTDDYLKVKVEDDGIGYIVDSIPDTTKGTGNGLRFMKERIDYIGGELRIASEIGKGSSVHIAVPIDS
ncbi:ATP-binding protein [Flavobacteriaceae bacterium]|nr:ATP-binding protein [Flavobacteriaceae bacterium]